MINREFAPFVLECDHDLSFFRADLIDDIVVREFDFQRGYESWFSFEGDRLIGVDAEVITIISKVVS